MRKQGFIEILAGTAQASKTARELGYPVHDPNELYKDPIEQEGPTSEHNGTQPEVQKWLIELAHGPTGTTISLMAPLCQSVSN